MGLLSEHFKEVSYHCAPASEKSYHWRTKRLIVILIEFVFNLFLSCLGETFYTWIFWFVFNFGSIILIMKLLRHFKKPVCPKSYSHWSDQYLHKSLKAGNKYGFKKASIILQNLGLLWIQMLNMNRWLDLCQHTHPQANAPDAIPASLNARCYNRTEGILEWV